VGLTLGSIPPLFNKEGRKQMNRFEGNKKIQEAFHNGKNPKEQEDPTYSANMAIQNRFYTENEFEDDIDTSLSMNSNLGAVLLPEGEEENK
jgi:hypothetical protein